MREGPSVEELCDELKSFLAERRKDSAGNWPAVDPDEYKRFVAFVGNVIDVKWARDGDGSSVIEFSAHDRSKWRAFGPHYVPQEQNNDLGQVSRESYFLRAIGALNSEASSLATLLEYLLLRNRDGSPK